MSTPPYSPTHQERSAKRRKIEIQAPKLIHPYGTKSTESNMGSVQLELTEVESKLRRLLLDVAEYIDGSSSSTEQITSVQVPEEVANEKIILRWTGGWVRDKLLNIESHDIDLAINKLTGEHFGLKMQEYLRIPGNAEKHGLIAEGEKLSDSDRTKKIAPGLHKIEANPEKSKNLETATTKILGIDLDLVNLRKETYNEVSRNPQMEFGTAEEDAMRRDATVNAMFYNLHTCEVEDFTKRGHEDMAARIIRTPLEPYQTFKDDPLRVLRLIRFASRLDYTIEPETAKAMGNPEIQDVLKIKISRERVGIELEKMLKGPRSRMALELIDRFGLYRTVFTDPTRDLACEPETAYFQLAYDFVESIVTKADDIPSKIPDNLLRNDDEKYLAWVCSTVMPWADAPMIPHPKPTQRPLFAAYLVAREGFKAPNKVCDVITASLSHSEEIRNHVAQCAKGLRRPDTIDPSNDFTARDTLGMAIRRWGPTWRTQVLFNMLYEVVLDRTSKQGMASPPKHHRLFVLTFTDILVSYAVFIGQVLKHGVQDVDTFKPLLKGTDLAKALNTKPGPWMKDALDVVMAWQLRNPDTTDPAQAIEAVKVSRGTKNDSELSSRLASHFLQLTIPPFFPQNKSASNALEVSRQPSPWRDAGNGHVLDLLTWSIGALNRKEIEAQWRFLMPPILKMIDDSEVESKAKGCQLLTLLLQRMQQTTIGQDTTVPTNPMKSNKPTDLLQRTGYHRVLADSLFPLLTYIPSLTPKQESVLLLSNVFPALLSLAHLLPQGDASSTPSTSPINTKTHFLDNLYRQGILHPLTHFPTPTTYPQLSTLLLSQLSTLTHELGIESAKHLSATVPLLSSILRDPFVLVHEDLARMTLSALRSVMENAWPRVPRYRGDLVAGLGSLWMRVKGGEGKGPDGEVELSGQIHETAEMLDAIMRASGEREVWEVERKGVEDLGGGLEGMFGG
ncbi:similar to tRNA nucleotidyltransferase [Plenodomus lingam JN3]|uniref:Similar to tRNA nucleotidyltransferase n=1 Tax=Leptosphaeria maculans (strain JN3 / isolate v23.1.3 / race Av1-4-5-6-7-8) TaxID=985895 RepID=E4ZR52_LEPMJ|nr:similar to tRNA nucleotidyltransferase [Plenodomus lingam JN3]CBX93717.1 similar to tRNA nucleotidyltransferase [Plenodomus lingam JN3]